MKKKLTTMKTWLVSGLLLVTITAQAQRNTPSGSAYPFPQNKTYTGGIKPTNVSISDVTSAYDSWKANYAEDCGAGKWRIKADDASFTFSEGIAYGMLLASYAADQPLFDGLWNYYKAFKNGKGVMHWKIQGCNTVNQQNGATDAELDAAYGLYMAHKQWGSAVSGKNYLQDGKDLINAIMNYEVNQSNWNLTNGDGWGATDCFNPSYFAPAYYKVFKTITGDTRWDNVYDRTYVLLNANKNATTGLVSNWCNSSGGVSSCNGPQDYGWDACRNPWRLSTDVTWYNSSQAKTLLDKQASFWSSKGAGGVSGPMPLGGGTGQYHVGAFIGPWAAGTMGCSSTYQSHCDAMYTENRNNAPSSTGNYFSGTLRLIGMFVQSGNFYLPAGAGVPLVSFTSSATSACEGGTVTFTDASTGTIDSYSWDFGTGATPATATTKGPHTVTYATAGTKTVTLTGSNSGGSASKTTFISVNQAGSTKFIKEDMSIATTTDYADGTGLYWWGDATAYAITKSVGKIAVKGTNVTNFKPFGVSFGDSNGDGTGTPFTKDFGTNMDIVIKIKNTVATDSAYINLNFEDALGGKGEIAPDTGIVSWTNKKQKIGFLLLPNETKTVVLSVSKDPALTGGLLATAWGCATANSCPTTKYTLDPTQISKIVFFVNGDASLPKADRVYPETSPYDGILEISYFVMGDSTAVCAPTDVTPPPAAAFTSDKLSVCQGGSIKFTNNSTGTITSYSWDFGADATPATSTTVGPHNVSWSTSGAKSVKLTVVGPDGTTTKTVNYTVNPYGPSKFVKDAFATTTQNTYADGTGLYWWTDPLTYTITRGGGKMAVKAVNATNFKAFGFGFGDSNGDGTGTLFSKDFGSNLDMYFTIKNTVATDSAYININFESAGGGIGEIHPDTGIVSWTNKKQKIGFLLLPNETKNVSIKVSADPTAVGGFKAVAYTCGSANACPVTSYTLDVSKITQVLFFVNGDASLPESDRVYPKITPYDGILEISKFYLGDSTTAGCDPTTGIAATNAASAFTAYPNPFNETITISQQGVSGYVSITVSNLMGQTVSTSNFSAEGSEFTKEISLAGLNSGIYFIQLKSKSGISTRKITKE